MLECLLECLLGVEFLLVDGGAETTSVEAGTTSGYFCWCGNYFWWYLNYFWCCDYCWWCWNYFWWFYCRSKACNGSHLSRNMILVRATQTFARTSVPALVVIVLPDSRGSM
jgi:hypothetical protein